MSQKKKVFCKDCVRWYCTQANQCNIPDPGIGFSKEYEDYIKAVGLKRTKMIDPSGLAFLKKRQQHTFHAKYASSNSEIYGHPSELNANNDCYFFKAKGFWAKIFGGVL